MPFDACPACGEPLISSVGFCGSCGYRFPTPPPVPPPDDYYTCKVCDACGHPLFMEAISVRRIEVEPGPEAIRDWADYLMFLLVENGPGCLESYYDRDTPDVIQWRCTSRLRGGQRVVANMNRVIFRPLLARVGTKYVDNVYGGYNRFGLRFEGDAENRPESFALYLCNEMETACWLKIYLCGVRGVWPFPGI